jgi:hypothetical protein
MWVYCFKHKNISVTGHCPDEDFELECGCRIKSKDIEKHRVKRVLMVGNFLLIKEKFQPRYDLVEVNKSVIG